MRQPAHLRELPPAVQFGRSIRRSPVSRGNYASPLTAERLCGPKLLHFRPEASLFLFDVVIVPSLVTHIKSSYGNFECSVAGKKFWAP